MSRKTILVIFCYNRPEASKARIKQLSNVNCPVMVSIDAQKSGIPLKDFDTLEKEFSPSVTFAKNQKNQGLAMHFVTRMSELFVNYENIIVIEDDVSVEKSTINYLIEILQERLPQDILSVGLFGFLPGKLMSRFGFNG
jgi:GT2 family glycosyltransferase